MANSAMKVISVLACMVLLLAALAEGQPNGPKPKKVKCQDKSYPQCYHVKQLCPDACPRTCYVDCVTCQPVCGQSLRPSSPYPSLTPPPVSTPPPSPPVYTPPPSPPTLSSPPVSTPPPSPPDSTPPTLTPPPVSNPPPSPPASSPPQSPPTLSPPPVSTPPPSPPASTPPTLTPPPVSNPPPSAPASSPPQSPPTLTPPRVSPPTYAPPPTSTPPSSPSSNSSHSPQTNPPPEVSGKRVYCKNRHYPKCYRMDQRCPAACPDQCEVDCVTCSPVCNCNRPGAVCQDPRFIGADGITFYFHGKKDKDFCIVSDSSLHINAHFIGRRNENMKRDFTWVQSLGILFDNNQLFVGAQKTAIWNNAVDRLDLAFNGQPIVLSEGEGAKWEPIAAPGVSITRSRDTNAVVIEVEGNFQIKATVVPITQKDSEIHKYGITEEDCFAHLDLSFKFYSLTGAVNGVLGQTYASNYVSRVKMGVDMPVLGGDKEFASSGLFTTDCAVARFSGTALAFSKNFGYANLKCVSGLNGRGVVCKR